MAAGRGEQSAGVVQGQGQVVGLSFDFELAEEVLELEGVYQESCGERLASCGESLLQECERGEHDEFVDIELEWGYPRRTS